MRVLIGGAGGQVGRALAATSPGGVVVTALDRGEFDVADLISVRAALDRYRPDVLINAAAYTAVDKAESDIDAAYRGNRDAPALLASEAAARSIHLTHISTDFVFDGRASSPYLPDAEPTPLGVYGASKAAGEAAVREILPTALIVRTAWVYAADAANFMRTMLRLMAQHPSLSVVADQIGTPTHARSLARGIWGLIAARATGVHHFTDAGVASWYDFAVAIQEEAVAMGLLDRAVPIYPIRTEDYPTPARRPAYSVLDKTATYAILGGAASHWRDELRLALTQLKAANG